MSIVVVKAPQTWVDEPTKTTPINKAHLDYMEQRATELAENMIRQGAFTPENFGAAGNGTTDDTVAMGNFLTAVGESKGKSGVLVNRYRTSSVLKVPVFSSIIGINQATCGILREGNGDTLDLEEGEITLRNFRMDWTGEQTVNTSHAIELTGAGGTDVRIEDLTLGGNFYNGISLLPTTLGGSIHVKRIRFVNIASSAISGVKGAALILGSTANRLVGATLEDIQCQAATKGGVARWLQANNCDTCTLTNALFQTGTQGVVVGREGFGGGEVSDGSAEGTTNLTFNNVVCDGGAEGMAQGWYLSIARAVDLNACHGQGAEMYLGQLLYGMTMEGGALQMCQNNGLRLGGAAASPVVFVGVKIGNNNITLPAGTATNVESSPFSADVLVENSAARALFQGCLLGNVFNYGATCRSYYPFWFSQTAKLGNCTNIVNDHSIWVKGGNSTKAFLKNENEKSNEANKNYGFGAAASDNLPNIIEW